jgi:hypothetical protein
VLLVLPAQTLEKQLQSVLFTAIGPLVPGFSEAPPGFLAIAGTLTNNHLISTS